MGYETDGGNYKREPEGDPNEPSGFPKSYSMSQPGGQMVAAKPGMAYLREDPGQGYVTSPQLVQDNYCAGYPQPADGGYAQTYMHLPPPGDNPQQNPERLYMDQSALSVLLSSRLRNLAAATDSGPVKTAGSADDVQRLFAHDGLPRAVPLLRPLLCVPAGDAAGRAGQGGAPAGATHPVSVLPSYRSERFISVAKTRVLDKTPTAQRKIGRLTFEERQRKIERYREKRNTRVWTKKISYTCRKRVADQRLRIKGRFVSKAEAKGLATSPKREDARTERMPARSGELAAAMGMEPTRKPVMKQIFSIIKQTDSEESRPGNNKL